MLTTHCLFCISITGCLDSIFINGNLARVLLAAHKIDGGQQHPEYLGEGLAWCDTLCALQLPITTSTGKSAGYWDTGYSQVYIADTGTAVAALAVCHSLADPARQATYEAALAKFTLFVTEGCSAPPPKPDVYSTACPPKGTGWVIAGGKDAGALGDGYYKKAINLSPYTIATATTGSCGFVEFDDIRPQPALQAIARNAVRWLMRSALKDGQIPYVITPPVTNGFGKVYQPISYSAESFVDVDLRYGAAMRGELAAGLNATVAFLVANQSADGSWGKWQKGSGAAAYGDAQRSPRALSLLQLAFQRLGMDDPAVGAAISKYATFLVDPAHRVPYGIGPGNWLALPTGFVGLSVADLLEPWSTFRPQKAGTGYRLGKHPLWG